MSEPQRIKIKLTSGDISSPGDVSPRSVAGLTCRIRKTGPEIAIIVENTGHGIEAGYFEKEGQKLFMSDQRPFAFWVYLLIFQIAFGLAIFAATREYYAGPDEESSMAATNSSRTTTTVTEPAVTFTPEMIDTLVTLQPDMTNPVEISRLADQYFANEQYDKAAEWYEKLLQFGPDNVDTLNNLGLTYHYLGRSEEALVQLNQGAKSDPAHQRVWLTLGFVNSDLGNVEQARTALSTAVQIDPDNSIGQSASGMLARLP